jgi:hypothetical protein
MSTTDLQQGGLNLRFGVNPTDQQVDAFINQQGGNPYTRALMGLGRNSVKRKLSGKDVANAGVEAAAQAQGVLGKFLEDAQAKLEEANADHADCSAVWVG